MIALPYISNIGLYATVAGESFNLNREDIRLRAYSGTGHMNVSRIYQKAPAQRGATDRGYSQDVRDILLSFRLHGKGLKDYYSSLRDELLFITEPRQDDPILFTFHVPGRGKRAAYFNMNGNLDFLPGDRIYTLQDVTGTFQAQDVRLFDPDIISINYSPVTSADGWLVPWPVPWVISGSKSGAVVTINYANGERNAAPEYPTIRAYGPHNGLIVRQVTTNQILSFSSLTIGVNDFIEIDLSSGPFARDVTTIRDSKGNSIEYLLDDDTDVSTFHLAPRGEKLYNGTYATGENVLSFEATNISIDTRFQIQYYNQYTGF